MNFAAELFLQAFALIFSVIVVAEIVAKALGSFKSEEEQ